MGGHTDTAALLKPLKTSQPKTKGARRRKNGVFFYWNVHNLYTHLRKRQRGAAARELYCVYGMLLMIRHPHPFQQPIRQDAHHKIDLSGFKMPLHETKRQNISPEALHLISGFFGSSTIKNQFPVVYK
jgi:hypothetical protein